MAINLNELRYPFDPTGNLASNKITNEAQVLTATNWRDYHFIIPDNAPFFAEGLKLSFRGLDNIVKPLELGKDYFLTHHFHDASLACAKPIYGSISFNDVMLSGVVIIDSYQTLGGIWTLDSAKIAQILAERLRNPRTTVWEQVVDMPVTFPVIDHEWNLVDMVGMKEVEAALWGIEAQLRLAGQQGLAEHINNFSNPHRVTAVQVGLGLVRNLTTASAAEGAQGTSNDLYMTPASTRAAMDAGPNNALLNHINDHNNPHQLKASDLDVWTTGQVAAELAKKLDKTAQAADTARFDGKPAVEFKAWVLEGTAANSIKFGGYTVAEYTELIKNAVSVEFGAGYTKPETDAKLDLKLDKTGKAADTTLFDGRTSAGYRDWVLSGTAANATQFNGLTQAQFTQIILDAVGSTIPNTYTRVEIDGKLSQKLDTTGTAADSNRFGGRDINAYKAWVLEGKSADSFRLNGKTEAELTAAILAGTAANSTKFNNMTYQELVASLGANLGGGARQVNYDAVVTGSPANWVRVGSLLIPLPGVPADARHADAHLIVTGGDEFGAAGSPVINIRVGVRGPSNDPVSMEITNTSSLSSNLVFGFTHTAGTNDGDLWVKAPGGRNGFAITELNTTGSFKPSVGETVAVEPVGIVYPGMSGGAFATKDDMEQILDAMTTAFTQLAEDLA